MMNTSSLKMIITVKFKVTHTRAGLPIYYNFPCIVAQFPSEYGVLQHLMRRARAIAERKIYRKAKRRVKGNLEFFIIIQGKMKRFVMVYPKIVVDPFGNIVKFKAPHKSLTYAYKLYVDYLKTMYAKTGDRKYWYKFLGVSTDPNYLEKKINYVRRMSEAKGEVESLDWNPLSPPIKGFETWLDRALKSMEPPRMRGFETWVDSHV